MIFDLLWVHGPSRSGKTTRLVEQFCLWVQGASTINETFYTKSTSKKSSINTPKRLFIHPSEPGVLVFAANNENRSELADKIVTATQGKYPIRVKTPLAFFQEEVVLFFPLLVELLNLKAQFPVRLRPETEQELARRLWRPHLDDEVLRRAGVNEYRFVRRVIDLMQLAAVSGNRCEDITSLLSEGLGNATNLEPEFYSELIIEWRDWCRTRGFLTYGVITELFCQHLLPNESYQRRLRERYQAIIADDVGDYPAVARDLFEVLLDKGAIGAFSYNPDNIVRLGLGADPVDLELLAERCRVEILTPPSNIGLGDALTTQMMEVVSEPMTLLNFPDNIKSIQTTSRAALLRQTGDTIVSSVKLKQVEPKDIVIIAPGLDAIAEYTLISILSKQNIHVNLLNNQRPLIASPLIRALLTLISLIYPGNGRLVDRDAVAEMLVILSRGNLASRSDSGVTESLDNKKENKQDNQLATPHYPHIDPVRAGLIADYCFVPHPDAPNLLPPTSFDRWDRLGYAATRAYEQILQWIETQRSRQQERVIPSPISLLYAAIEKFFLNVTNLPYDQITTLRELLETAQHYWEIDTRLRSQKPGEDGSKTQQLTLPVFNAPFATNSTIAEFIQLLRRGTIVSYPYPVRPVGPAANAVTISTIFQYRSSRKAHKWHFWLDAGSYLWAKGGAATLYGANLFLRDRLGQPWTAEDETLAENQRVKRILADLLARVQDRLYLCHSELAVNGTEQLGPLLPLVNASLPLTNET